MAETGSPTSFQQAADLYRAGKLHEAEVAARRIVDADPNYVAAMNLLGVIAHDVGRNDIAVHWLSRAIRIDPTQGMLFNNMGECFRAIGQGEQAIVCYRAAIERDPQDPNPRNNMAIVQVTMGHMDEAIATWRELVAVQPGYLTAYNNLGNALLGRGQAREAAQWHRRAVEADPGWAAAHSNLLRDLEHLPEITGERLLEEHRAWWRAHGEPLARNVAPHGNDRDPERTLVVGWVSPDFREHAVASFIEPVLAEHDRLRMRFIAYSELEHEDEWTGRLKGYFEKWRRTFGVTDEQVERQIREDRVDILVDLAGHTAKNRAKLMARQAAPVQVSYLGYSCTTGIETIGWRITDAKADPVGMTEQHYTEKLLRLGRTAWCYRPLAGAPEVGELPADRNGYVTFGSFNNLAKINDDVIAAWVEILRRVPSARLLLKYTGLGEPSVQHEMREKFAGGGIEPQRIVMRGRDETIPQHIARYAEMDIALDTFPYNGTTTTCEALWMGVPVVTVAGKIHLSRVGASLLETVGLSELVGENVQEYVAKAVELAGDVQRVRELRKGLRGRIKGSALRDEVGFAREVERMLREMWREWCGG